MPADGADKKTKALSAHRSVQIARERELRVGFGKRFAGVRFDEGLLVSSARR
jgi:hypothetical protein